LNHAWEGEQTCRHVAKTTRLTQTGPPVMPNDLVGGHIPEDACPKEVGFSVVMVIL
jgi:hypothetical protein